MRRGPTMFEWRAGDWRLGLVYPRFWSWRFYLRRRPFWLLTPIVQAWKDGGW